MSITNELSDRAASFVSFDSDELRRRNSRTRAFISKFRLGNPIRRLLAKKQKVIWVQGATGEWLNAAELAEVLQIGFIPIGRYAQGTLQFERWIGPDGFVCLEISRQSRFLSSYFENNTKVVTGPGDQSWQQMADGQPEHVFLNRTESFRADYLEILEVSVDHAQQAGCAPLYQADSRDLVEAVSQYYEEHIVSMSMVGVQIVQMGVEAISGIDFSSLTPDVSAEMGYKMFDSIFVRAAHTDDGAIQFVCESCGGSVRFPIERLSAKGKCGRCKERIVPSHHLLKVKSARDLEAVVERAPIPIVLAFWSPTQTQSLTVLGTFFDAGVMADGQFVVFSLDVSELPEVASKNSVADLPVAIRFAEGAETHRQEGVIGAQDATAFGIGR